MQTTTDPSPKKGREPAPSASFTTGVIALVFLIVGYQSAVFVHKAALSRVAAHRDRPDTVYVWMDGGAGEDVLPGPVDLSGGDARPSASRTVRKSGRSPSVARALEKAAPRPRESFRFNPNTVSLEDLQRLGFSEKQALSIIHYREKGGRFRRKEDFAKSFVVADSVYERLKPFIDIPKIDINRADSAALTALPGIGPWFAAKIVSYRKELGGFSYPEQLMDIWHFDREKYDGLSDLITLSPAAPYPLWTLPESDLARHPYIGTASRAHAIVLFRENNPPDSLSVGALHRAGILSDENASRLSRCRLAEP